MNKYIVGIDEAGRGPIAGPVAVGVVGITKDVIRYFPKLKDGKRFKDSKKLNEKIREETFAKLQKYKKLGKLNFSVSMVGQNVIDEIGIVRAIAAAIARSLRKINLDPEKTFVYLDGRLRAPSQYRQATLVKGDTRELSIALASIAAKVTRDRYMIKIAEKYPKYGFEKHKGYGTRTHYRAIQKHGICSIHRKTFLKK